MAVQLYQQRTSEILDRYHHENALIDASEDPYDGPELLITETIRLLRENKTDCVRSEQSDAARIVGERHVAKASVDLGHGRIKAEIDEAIAELSEAKSVLRVAKAEALAMEADADDEIDDDVAALDLELLSVTEDEDNEQLLKLVDLHMAGLLSTEEFAVAKQRLL